jgi:hypothetical protein
MLRIVVISLFLANLLLLAFQMDQPVSTKVPLDQQTRSEHNPEDNNLPTIHLFSELIQDQDLISGGRQCFNLGPFLDVGDKDQVRARLQVVAESIGERQSHALVEQGYWVFMRPYNSLLEANEALLSLQALGLEDIRVLYSGEFKNSISLGYFLRQENALERRRGLEERGYTPMILVQRKNEVRYWLDYEQSPGSEMITLDMQNRPNDFMLRPMPCAESDPNRLTAGLVETQANETGPQQADVAENIDSAPAGTTEGEDPNGNTGAAEIMNNDTGASSADDTSGGEG